MSERVHVCKICGKKFATPKAVYGHLRIHSGKDDDRSSLSRNLHVCKICGKKFATSRSLGSHKRIHSGKRNRNVDENEIQCLLGLYSSANENSGGSSLSLSMTEIDQNEMNEAAMSLVMFSEQVYDFPRPPGDISMDLEHKPVPDNILLCVESKLDSHSGFEKSSSCSDVVAYTASPLTSGLQKRPESNVRYRFKICGKIFGRSQALGDHQRLHRSIRGQLARKREDFGGGTSLSGLSEAKKIASQLPSFEVSQEELTELRDTNVKKHFVESSEVFSHSGFETSSDVVVAQALPSLLRSKLQGKPESNSSRKCRICGKNFGCYRALNDHQGLHRSTSGQIACKRMILEDGNSLLV